MKTRSPCAVKDTSAHSGERVGELFEQNSPSHCNTLHPIPHRSAGIRGCCRREETEKPCSMFEGQPINVRNQIRLFSNQKMAVVLELQNAQII